MTKYFLHSLLILEKRFPNGSVICVDVGVGGVVNAFSCDQLSCMRWVYVGYEIFQWSHISFPLSNLFPKWSVHVVFCNGVVRVFFKRPLRFSAAFVGVIWNIPMVTHCFFSWKFISQIVFDFLFLPFC